MPGTEEVLKVTCPVCGSADISASNEQRFALVPYGPSVPYALQLYRCGNCAEIGDFIQHNDAAIDSAHSESKKKSIEPMLFYLAGHGISKAYFERALDLPPRTLARWKTEECSAAGVALLRMVRTLPWLLEIAENHYDEMTAKEILIRETAKVLGDVVNHRKLACQVQISAGGESVEVHASLKPITSPAKRMDANTLFRQLP